MLSRRVKVKPDQFLKDVVHAAYPAYNGRKYKLEVATGPLDVRDSWDGGSRTYFVFVHLETLKVVPVPSLGSINDKVLPGADRVELPPDVVCVEHIIFCGKDCGVTVVMHPQNAPKLLAAGGAVP